MLCPGNCDFAIGTGGTVEYFSRTRTCPHSPQICPRSIERAHVNRLVNSLHMQFYTGVSGTCLWTNK